MLFYGGEGQGKAHQPFLAREGPLSGTSGKEPACQCR